MKSKCGDCTYCCEVLSFVTVGIPPKEVRDFYKARGCTIQYEKETTFITAKYPCPNLEKGVGCKIYDKRPSSCRHFDGRDNPVTRPVCKLK